MIKVPTNQSASYGASVGKATSSGVYVAGRKVASKLGAYTGGVLVVRTQGGAVIVKMPSMLAGS